jgi:hypothetical protein
MKKIIFAVLVLAIGITVKAQEGQQNVIKFNPLGLLIGSANLSFEHALSEKNSIQIDASFGSLKVGDAKYSTIGGGLDYKFYLSNSKSAPQGFYAAPGVSFSSIKVKVTDPYNGNSSSSGSTFIVRGVIGNQWIWNGGFSLDLFGGINYYAGGKLKVNGVEYTKFSGILPALGVSLGFAF